MGSSDAPVGDSNGGQKRRLVRLRVPGSKDTGYPSPPASGSCTAGRRALLTMKQGPNVSSQSAISQETIADWYNFCRELVVERYIGAVTSRGLIGGPGTMVQIDEAVASITVGDGLKGNGYSAWWRRGLMTSAWRHAQMAFEVPR